MIIREMCEAECYRIIESQQLARLACSKGDQPYIVPIQYAFSMGRIFTNFHPKMNGKWHGKHCRYAMTGGNQAL
jgi:nitroimidazol reductase NimA-like FMN-containing flavoprotein (pyridoxamine 5'-phosphate oxidase superfamily)